MIFIVALENGVKKIKPLTSNTGSGNPVGSYLCLEKKSAPSGYLYCDGSTFDANVYPVLYQYLGTNVLPDCREFAFVGAEQNTTNVYNAATNPTGVIHAHDVFAEGEYKDDQLQDHTHDWKGYVGTAGSGEQQVKSRNIISSDPLDDGTSSVNSNYRAGTVTRGKRKAVFIYIKATSGLTENQQDNVLATINENLSYSTEEHFTGKKWLDGKNVYSKTLPQTTAQITASTWGFGGLSSNVFDRVDHIIKAYGITEVGLTSEHTCVCQASKSLGFYSWSNMASGTIITVEYTKTTN